MASAGGWGSGFSAPKRRHDDHDEAAQPAKRQRAVPTPAHPSAVAPASPISLINHALSGALAPLEAALDADPSLLDRPQSGGMYDSRTLLQSAASKGHEAVVRALLARGANAAAVDKRGATAAALATSQGHTGVAALLAGVVVAPAPAPAPSAAATVAAPPLALAPPAALQEASGSSLASFVASLRLPPAVADVVSAKLEELGYDDPADYGNLDDAEVSGIESDLLAAGVARGHVGRAVRAIRAGGAPPPLQPAPSASVPVGAAAATPAVGGKRQRDHDETPHALPAAAQPAAPQAASSSSSSSPLNPNANPFVPKQTATPDRPDAKRQRPFAASPAGQQPASTASTATSATSASTATSATSASALNHALSGALAPLEAALDADPSLLDRPQSGGMYDSRTLLQSAASKGHEAVVRALLARGANAAAVDKRGATAAALATSQGHTGVAALLAGVVVAPAPAPAPSAAEEDAVGVYSDAELLAGTAAETAPPAAKEEPPGGPDEQAADIYGILTEGADADLL